MRSGVTAFVVFKDGHQILRRCLDSLRPAVDELIAVDTGAADGSREVAQQAGARIFDLVWPDSFSDAYNFAIQRVETEWTLWMDSDEWLLPESVPLLRDAIGRDDTHAYHLIRQDLYGPREFTEMYLMRLWRTHARMRLRGAIHSNFPPEALGAASEGRKVEYSEIRIRHDGLGNLTREKLLRNIQYIQRELRDRPSQLYFQISLADAFLCVDDPRGAGMIRDLADQVIAMDSSPPEHMVALLLGLALELIVPDEFGSARTRKVVDRLLAWHPDSPPALWALSVFEERRGNVQNEFDALLRVEQLMITGRHNRHVSFPPWIFGEPLFSRLAVTAHRLGRLDVARRNYQRLLELNPQHPLAVGNLAHL
ncbi:MAG: glycosyltransferase [Tepidisphaeraceae bacterium]